MSGKSLYLAVFSCVFAGVEIKKITTPLQKKKKVFSLTLHVKVLKLKRCVYLLEGILQFCLIGYTVSHCCECKIIYTFIAYQNRNFSHFFLISSTGLPKPLQKNSSTGGRGDKISNGMALMAIVVSNAR